MSDHIDRVVLSRTLGIPLFLLVMYLMFVFTINRLSALWGPRHRMECEGCGQIHYAEFPRQEFVIDRHVTQGTRSAKGQRANERLWTVIATCALQGRSAFEIILRSGDLLWGGMPTAVRNPVNGYP